MNKNQLKNETKITGIIPTLNEEKFIEGAIASLSFAEELIVIDSYSSDRTVEIAQKHGARIFKRKFDNFSGQKNFAINQASHDWIFILDADERISPALKVEILTAARNPGSCKAFFIYRTFYYKDSKIRFSGKQTDKVIRLFRRDYCRYDGKLVHEKIDCYGEIGFLTNRIDHFSFRDIDQYRNKLAFYAKLQARELKMTNKNIPTIYRWFKPGFRFIMHFIIRLGFLDGSKGFVLSRLHAGAVAKRYLELDSLRKTNSS